MRRVLLTTILCAACSSSPHAPTNKPLENRPSLFCTAFDPQEGIGGGYLCYDRRDQCASAEPHATCVDSGPPPGPAREPTMRRASSSPICVCRPLRCALPIAR